MTAQIASQFARQGARAFRGQVDPTPRVAHPEWRSVPRAAPTSVPAAFEPRAVRVSNARVRVRRTIAVLVLATAVLLGVFALGRASVHAAQLGPDTHSATPAVVTVQVGDTLWSIAHRLAPNADPRATIRAIRELNGLATANLQAGQRLVIPR